MSFYFIFYRSVGWLDRVGSGCDALSCCCQCVEVGFGGGGCYIARCEAHLQVAMPDNRIIDEWYVILQIGCTVDSVGLGCHVVQRMSFGGAAESQLWL